MKSKYCNIFLLFFIIFISTKSYSQKDPYYFVFNTLNYFAPADSHFSTINETSYEKSEITIQLNTNNIIIKVNYSDGPVESIYNIKKVSELIESQGEGQFYTFTCLASNYAKTVIDVSKEAKWVRLKIMHNGITHKYYNR